MSDMGMTAPEVSTFEMSGASGVVGEAAVAKEATMAGEAAAAAGAPEAAAAAGAPEPNTTDELTEPEFFDSLFRKRKKHGDWKIVEAPDLSVLAVDAHCHLQYQKNPGLALARAGLHGVGFMCTVVDVYEDGATTYDSLSKWNHEAALSMQRLFSRC